MQNDRRYKIFGSLILLFSLFVCVEGRAQLTIVSPGAGDIVVPSASDYATEVLCNPWDMDSIDDYANFILHADFGHGLSSFRSWDFTGGVSSFSILQFDSAFVYMLSPGPGPSTIVTNVGKSGQNFPIDSTKYRYLHIRMNTDSPGELAVTWHTDIGYSVNYVRGAGVATVPGWRTYTFDLDNIHIPSSFNENRSWAEAGEVTGLRIEPGSEGNVEIDWIRLTDRAPVNFTVNYSFTPSGADTVYSLFVDDDTDPLNGGVLILANGERSTINAEVDISALPPGEYYITGVTDGGQVVVSPGKLIVNDPPAVKITVPNRIGGRDFAAEELGNPWNMGDPWDFYDLRNHEVAAILPNNFIHGRQGDFFYGVSTLGNPDPYETVYRSRKKSDPLIDATIYKNWTYIAYVQRQQDIVHGSVGRMIWQRNGKNFNADDIVIPGDEQGKWHTITQDMTEVDLRTVIHPVPPPYPWSGLPPKGQALSEDVSSSPRTQRAKKKKKKKKKKDKKGGLVQMVRVDVHEYSDSPPGSARGTEFWIDRIELRADHDTNTRFAFTYEVNDADTDPNDIRLSAYYTPNKESVGGSPIFENRVLGQTTRVFLWDTSGIPNGTYYVYLVANDGSNSFTYLGHRVVVDHRSKQDATAPVLQVDRPVQGEGVFKTLFLEGYAIDEYQVAVIEVLVDGVLVGTMYPSLFRKDARARFPRYADASNAGFRSGFNIEEFSLGSHSVVVKVYDVGGNITSQTFSITRSAGDDVNAPGPNPENDAPLELPLSGEIPVQLKAKINAKKGALSIKVVNANLCVNASLVAHKNARILKDNPAKGIPLFNFTNARRSEVFSARKLKSFRGSRLSVALICQSPDGRADVFAPVTLRGLSNLKGTGRKIGSIKKFVALVKKETEKTLRSVKSV